MMKLTAVVLMVFAFACGGSKKSADAPVSNTDPSAGSAAPATTGEGTPCEQEIALECPDGQIDGCLKTPAEGTTHACVAK